MLIRYWSTPCSYTDIRAELLQRDDKFISISLRNSVKCDSLDLVFAQSWHSGVCDCDGVYQHPAVETDAEGQVQSREYQQSPESLQQQGHQAHLEHIGVEHHQQDDDHIEQNGNVLDAAKMTKFYWFIFAFSF